MAIDITGLLTGVLSPEQKATAKMNEGVNLANVVGQLGGASALLAPTRAAQATGGLSRLLGVDARPPQERVAEALTSLDLNQPEDQAKAIQLLQQNGLQDEALRLSQAIQANNEQTAATRQTEQNREQQQRAAMTAIAQSNLPDPAKEALRGLVRTNAITDYDALYERLGFDASGAAEAAGLENIDPDAYTPESLNAYTASVAAGNPDYTLLQRNATEPAPGYDFYTNSEGIVVGQIPQRGTEEYIAARDATRADNNRGEQAIRIADNVVELVDEAALSLREGRGEAGLMGALLRYFPGTNTYDLGEDLDTIKANLGFDRLQEMRDNSPTGGALGQVSELELQQLERALRSLTIGQSKDQLLANLQAVKQQYETIMSKARTDVTLEEYLGLEDPKPVSDFIITVVE